MYLLNKLDSNSFYRFGDTFYNVFNMNKEMVVLVVVVVVTVFNFNSHTLEFFELKKNNISLELMHSNGDQIEWFS